MSRKNSFHIIITSNDSKQAFKKSEKTFKEAENWIWGALLITLCFHKSVSFSSLEVSSPSYPSPVYKIFLLCLILSYPLVGIGSMMIKIAVIAPNPSSASADKEGSDVVSGREEVVVNHNSELLPNSSLFLPFLFYCMYDLISMPFIYLKVKLVCE